MGSWFSSTFIRSFLQLCNHHEHLENTQIEYKLVHCVWPDTVVEQIIPLRSLQNNVKYLLCPICNGVHFYFIQFDIEKKLVLCYDGKRTNLLHSHNTIRYILHKYQMIDDSTSKKSFPYGWHIKYANFLIQEDNHSCGPICCYYIWMKLQKKNRIRFNMPMNQLRIKVVDQFKFLIGKYKNELIRCVRHVNKKQQQKISKYCAICLEEVTTEADNAKVDFFLTCHHGKNMHKKCVDSFAKTNGTCFICNKVAKPHTIQTDFPSQDMIDISTDEALEPIFNMNDKNIDSGSCDKLQFKHLHGNNSLHTSLRYAREEVVSIEVSHIYMHLFLFVISQYSR